jgi:G:T-mismatch repair DNA endonuclease (very short patch repair protein)
VLDKKEQEPLNWTVLANLAPNRKLLMVVGVEFDFEPKNATFLRRSRLDFLAKKNHIINFLSKNFKDRHQRGFEKYNQYKQLKNFWLRRVSSNVNIP